MTLNWTESHQCQPANLLTSWLSFQLCSEFYLLFQCPKFPYFKAFIFPFYQLKRALSSHSVGIIFFTAIWFTRFVIIWIIFFSCCVYHVWRQSQCFWSILSSSYWLTPTMTLTLSTYLVETEYSFIKKTLPSRASDDDFCKLLSDLPQWLPCFVLHSLLVLYGIVLLYYLQS